MAGPLVSAIIPAYGRSRQTQRAIDSVAAQTYSPLELIVVDDGSEPPLAPQLELPSDTVERAMVIRRAENRGANAARNTGIDHADGTYVAFLDSDDEWRPEKTTRQLAALTDTAASAAYTSVEQVDSAGRRTGIRHARHSGDLRTHLLTGNVIGTFSSVLIAATATDAAGRPDPTLPCWQDWEWYLRLAEAIRFVACDELLVRRYNHEGQLSRSFAPKVEQGVPVLRERLLDVARTDREARRALSALQFQLGYAALINGRYATARRCFVRSLRKQPTAPDRYVYLLAAGQHYPVLRALKRALGRAIRLRW